MLHSKCATEERQRDQVKASNIKVANISIFIGDPVDRDLDLDALLLYVRCVTKVLQQIVCCSRVASQSSPVAVVWCVVWAAWVL